MKKCFLFIFCLTFIASLPANAWEIGDVPIENYLARKVTPTDIQTQLQGRPRLKTKEGEEYYFFNVRGNGNCGIIAMGLERDIIIKQLLDHIDSDHYLRMLIAPDIKGAILADAQGNRGELDY